MSGTKRFYKTVSVEKGDGGFEILLDGRHIKTPEKAALLIPSRALAEAVAEEWRAQGEQIRPDTMPLTRHVNSGIDRVAPQREGVLQEILRYAETDQCCYRADDPDELVARQAEAWDPLLDWARDTHGLHFVLTTGIMPAQQPDALFANARAAIETMDDCALSAFYTVVAVSGSFVMGLAARDGRLDAGRLYEAALVDELFQAEKWGSDYEAEDRREGIRRALDGATRLFSLLKSDA